MAHPIEFKLFAPYNQEATLMGSFSDWQEIPMEKNDRGYFQTQVQLEDGSYEYKFRVRTRSWFYDPDQWVDVIDPYATEINPSQQNAVIHIKGGEKIIDRYVWQHDDKPLSPNRDLIIYELHISDFSGGENDPYVRGQFKHAIAKLDYLCDLGINAIQLMPVNEFPGDYSWGYNVRHYFAVESSYGSSSDLKQLIDECHARGIRVIVDGIYNHSEPSSPLTKIDHDYWYHHDPRDPSNYWGPEFNYEHYDENLDVKPAWQFIGDVVCFWIQEYHIDGIRYDAARQLANYKFMNWIVEQTREYAGMKPFYNIAEHIPDTPDITNLDGPMDGCWHESFLHTVKDQVCGDRFDLKQLKDVLDGKRQGYLGASNIINYIASHDHKRWLVELADRDIFGKTAFKRTKLGAVLLLTSVGVPMIWMGEEFGDYHLSSPQPAKLNWTLLENELDQDLWKYYQGLVHLRRENSALRTDNIEFFHEDRESKVLAYIRWNQEGARIVVAANFSDRYLENYKVTNFPKDGTWHEWTGNYDVKAENDQISIDLPEYEAQVFVE